MIYGIDVSHYQPGFDFFRAKREGFEFAILKASEGNSYVNPMFTDYLGKARAAGLIVAAYHYVRSGSSVAAQAGLVERLVPKDCPVILDVENGAGGIGLVRELNAELNRRGFRTPLLYLPMWYWQQIGSPDLRGLPPLWYSRYANNNGGYASQIWERSAGWYNQFWGGYGGLPVEVLQFSSSASVAGTTPVDVNIYRGTREQLAALMGGGYVEIDMQLSDGYQDWAGNDQTVESTYNHLDQRSYGLDVAFFAPGSEPSRIPGDENRTNLRDAIMDTVARVSIAKAEIEDLHRKVDGLTSPEVNVDLDALAVKVAEKLGDDIANKVADVFRARLES